MERVAHGSADAALALFEQLLDLDWLAVRRREIGWRGGGGFFSAALTIWVSVRQKVMSPCSLEKAWALCSDEEAKRLSPTSARAQKGARSARASGLDHARHAIPLTLVEEATDRIFWEAWSSFRLEGLPTFLLDGSSVTTEAWPELVAEYPPAPTQHGTSHWPVLRMVVAHDLATGLAVRPEWGPFFGPDAVGEHTLAKRLLDRLPKKCMVIADRNFGIFQMAWALQDRKFLIRLKEKIAGSLSQRVNESDEDFDEAYVWKPSKADRKKHGFDGEACVPGRLIAVTLYLPGKDEPTRLSFFTNDMETDADEIVAGYTARWNIETDIRALKQSCGLEAPKSQSVDMLGKEINLAVIAYNLVRVTMVQAAHTRELDSRRISFTRTRDCMEAFVARGPINDQTFDEMLRYIAAAPLPLRPDRHFKREMWTKANRYPQRKPKRN